MVFTLMARAEPTAQQWLERSLEQYRADREWTGEVVVQSVGLREVKAAQTPEQAAADLVPVVARRESKILMLDLRLRGAGEMRGYSYEFEDMRASGLVLKERFWMRRDGVGKPLQQESDAEYDEETARLRKVFDGYDNSIRQQMRDTETQRAFTYPIVSALVLGGGVRRLSFGFQEVTLAGREEFAGRSHILVEGRSDDIVTRLWIDEQSALLSRALSREANSARVHEVLLTLKPHPAGQPEGFDAKFLPHDDATLETLRLSPASAVMQTAREMARPLSEIGTDLLAEVRKPREEAEARQHAAFMERMRRGRPPHAPEGAAPAPSTPAAPVVSVLPAPPVVSAPAPTPPSAPVPPPVASLPMPGSVPAPAEVKPTSPPVVAESMQLTPEQMNGIVVIEGDAGQGSGFITEMKGVSFVVTNIHVVAGNERIKVRRLGGGELKVVGWFGAMGSDVAILRLAEPTPGLKLMPDLVSGAKHGDQVAVVGNRRGGGVATQVRGQVVGVGPDRVEIDAPFEEGNSGSPIFHVATGEVLGVAAYSSSRILNWKEIQRAEARGEKLEEKVERRWFGFRVDAITGWQQLDVSKLKTQVAQLTDYEAMSDGLLNVLRGRFDQAADVPALRQRLNRFNERASRVATNGVSMADEIRSLLAEVRAVGDASTRELKAAEFYDFFGTSLYFSTSLKEQQRYREAIMDALRETEGNIEGLRSRLRNGG